MPYPIRLNVDLRPILGNGFAAMGSASEFIKLYDWTPNFNGVNSYGELLSAYSPTGAGANLETGFLYKSDGAIQQLLAPELSTFNITISATDVISWDLLTGVEINGVAATSGVTTVLSGYYVLTGTLDSTADIKVLAANASFTDNFQTQLHYLNIDDPLDISNSIEIDTVIRAAGMPSDINLYNKLTNVIIGTLINLDATQPYVLRMTNVSYPLGQNLIGTTILGV